MARTVIALAAAVIICAAGWAITAPLLVQLVHAIDQPWSPRDPEGLGYIIYSAAALLLAVPIWIYISVRAYTAIKRRIQAP